MSFDLLLVRMPAGASEEEIGDAAMAAAEAELPDTPPDPATEAQKRALADAMLATFPELHEDEFDYPEIALSQGMTERDARRRYRWIQLNGLWDGAGIEIDLYDGWASMSMPFGRPEYAEADMAEMWRYLEVLVREGGFVVYDPQGANVVDVEAGPHGTLGIEKTQREPRRSWWRFW
jgi:hypothetical protein